MNNPAFTWGTGIPFAAVAIWHVWLLATRTADPREYSDRGDRPMHMVVGVSLLVLIEAAIMWLVLFSHGAPSRWRRALLGVVLTVPPTLLAFVMSHVHEPAYQMIHTTWLFELSVIASTTFAISALGALVSRFRTTSGRQSGEQRSTED